MTFILLGQERFHSNPFVVCSNCTRFGGDNDDDNVETEPDGPHCGHSLVVVRFVLELRSGCCRVVVGIGGELLNFNCWALLIVAAFRGSCSLTHLLDSLTNKKEPEHTHRTLGKKGYDDDDYYDDDGDDYYDDDDDDNYYSGKNDKKGKKYGYKKDMKYKKDKKQPKYYYDDDYYDDDDDYYYGDDDYYYGDDDYYSGKKAKGKKYAGKKDKGSKTYGKKYGGYYKGKKYGKGQKGKKYSYDYDDYY